MGSRIDDFPGSEHEYVQFLEQALISLRAHHRSCVTSCTAGSENTLNIIQWTPVAKRPRTDSPTWKEDARTLVKSTPKANQWWQAIRANGIYEPLSNGNAAAYVLDSQCSLVQSATATALFAKATAAERSGLLARVAAYAHTAIRRETTATAAIMLANFQKLLVLSSCAVLNQTGSPKEDVFDIVKICIGPVGDRYCRQTLRTAVYLNQLVDMLSSHGWGERASDLLLICECLSRSFLMQAHCAQGIDRQRLIMPLQVHQSTASNTSKRSFRNATSPRASTEANGFPSLSRASSIKSSKSNFRQSPFARTISHV